MARSGSTDRTDADALRREFTALPFASRRAVVRAVSRGVPVEDRRLAVHAVVVARRQQRLWRWLWLTGPLIGLTQLTISWQTAVVAAVISTVTMAVLARFWLLRAQRAERDNLALVPKRQRARLGPSPGAG